MADRWRLPARTASALRSKGESGASVGDDRPWLAGEGIRYYPGFRILLNIVTMAYLIKFEKDALELKMGAVSGHVIALVLGGFFLALGFIVLFGDESGSVIVPLLQYASLLVGTLMVGTALFRLPRAACVRLDRAKRVAEVHEVFVLRPARRSVIQHLDLMQSCADFSETRAENGAVFYTLMLRFQTEEHGDGGYVRSFGGRDIANTLSVSFGRDDVENITRQINGYLRGA